MTSKPGVAFDSFGFIALTYYQKTALQNYCKAFEFLITVYDLLFPLDNEFLHLTLRTAKAVGFLLR